MNYKYIIKNSDINENDTNKYIYYFYKHSYKDNINYLSNNMNSIKMMYLSSCMKSNSLCYLPYSICFIYIYNNYITGIDKLPPTLKMIRTSFIEIIWNNNIYNLPLLINYIIISKKLFKKYINILGTYIKITDVILHNIPQIDRIEKLNISYNIHRYSTDLYYKYINLSLQN